MHNFLEMLADWGPGAQPAEDQSSLRMQNEGQVEARRKCACDALRMNDSTSSVPTQRSPPPSAAVAGPVIHP